jgi:hypothetical protein
VLPADLNKGLAVPATDQAGARQALTILAIRIREIKEEVDESSAPSLDSAASIIDEERVKHSGDGALSGADVSNLNNLVSLTRPVVLKAYQDSAARFLSLLPQLLPSSEDTQRLQWMEEDIAEAMHGQFLKGDKSGLAKILDMTNKVKEWNSTIGDYAKKTEEWGKKLDGVKAAKDASDAGKRVKDLSESLGEEIGQIKDVVSIAKDLSTVVMATDAGNGTEMMKGVAQFEAAMNLLDKVIGKWGKAVPVFNDLWSKWYKPMVDAAIKGLSKIAGLMEVKDRDDVIGGWMVEGGSTPRDANGAPIIPKLYQAKGAFPGGQPVLSYLWCLREGKPPPAMSAPVHDFLYKNKDLFNEAFGKEGELDYKFHLFSKNELVNPERWLEAHWADVWKIVYGRYGSYVPH